jgi:hypothetical protein
MNTKDKVTVMNPAQDLVAENGLKSSPQGATELIRD